MQLGPTRRMPEAAHEVPQPLLRRAALLRHLGEAGRDDHHAPRPARGRSPRTTASTAGAGTAITARSTGCPMSATRR